MNIKIPIISYCKYNCAFKNYSGENKNRKQKFSEQYYGIAKDKINESFIKHVKLLTHVKLSGRGDIIMEVHNTKAIVAHCH